MNYLLYGMALFLVVAFLDKFTFLLKSWKFLCKFPSWHIAKASGFDGCSNTGTCIRCGKKVLQDNNGDWFIAYCQD